MIAGSAAPRSVAVPQGTASGPPATLGRSRGSLPTSAENGWLASGFSSSPGLRCQEPGRWLQSTMIKNVEREGHGDDQH